ncbi:MAG: VWA domain-containing protein [Chloroflexi bacterium]|nr:VWA domain-containing protein [Chloroflexota bacterium]
MKPKKPQLKRSRSEIGQGLVEYAIILIFVAISVVLVLEFLGPTVDNTFDQIVSDVPGGTPVLAHYTPPPTSLATSTHTSTPDAPPPAGTSTSTPTPSITPTPTETPTVQPSLTPSATPTALPESANLCAGGTPKQSSTSSGRVAARACDGNINGNISNNSVAQTNNDTNPYWEVDLGSVYVLEQLKIFSRTDCGSSCYPSNFIVLISESPMPDDLAGAQGTFGVKEYQFDGDVDSFAFAMQNITGRYVRIQLAGSGQLNLAEVEVTGSLNVASACENITDMFYIFDVSGSMNGTFPGANNKIEAAKEAVTRVNNEIIAANNDSRVGSVTFTTTGSYTNNGGYWHLNILLDTFPLSTNIASLNAEVQTWSPVGGTPTGSAINAARLTMINTWDPKRVPIVVLVSDGVPTVDLLGRYYPDSYVQNVDVYNNDGTAKNSSQVANTGSTSSYNKHSPERAGVVVAQVMDEINELTRSLPNAVVHSIAIAGGSGFNTEVLQYVADVGGGDYFAADNASELGYLLSSIFAGVDCDPDS